MNVRRKKILRDLFLNKSRSLLVILAVAVGVAAFGLMVTGGLVLDENLRLSYASTGPAHTILSLSPFDKHLLKHVQGLDYVLEAQARRVDQARVSSGPDTWLSFEIQTLPDFTFLSINRLLLEGRVALPPAKDTILLERSLQNIMQVGDSIEVQLLNGDMHRLSVGGFVNDLSHLPSELTLVGLGYISPETADTLGFQNEYNQLLVVFSGVRTRQEAEVQTTKLVKDLEGAGYRVLSASVPVPEKYVLGDNMASVSFILNSLGGLTLILSAFLVTSVMAAIMSQQIPQIGILKSLGGNLGQTMSLYFQEVFAFGVFALLLAIPMGLIGAYFMADGIAQGMNFSVTRFRLPMITLILQALGALLAPLLASLFPILSGARITIREAISNYKPEAVTRLGLLRFFSELPQLINLSVRNAFRRKVRLALTFVTLLLAGSMFIAVIDIRQSMRAAVKELQGELNYDVNVDFVRPYSTRKMAREVGELEDVLAVETWAVENGRLVFGDDHLSGGIILYGVPEGTQMARPGVIEGSWLSAGTPRGIFVSADVLDLSPSLKVGSVITLNIEGREEQWTILGASGRSLAPIAYVFYEDLARQTGLDGLANRLVIQTRRSEPAFQSSVQSNVLARLDQINFDILGSQTTTELKETNAAQLDVLIILLLVMVVLIAVVGGLGLAITMSLNVMERTREIGILRSLGAGNGVVRRVVILEGLVIGLISWALAVPCSIPLAIWLGNSLGLSLLASPLDYIFSAPAVYIWLGLMVVISIIASLIPAQNAARLTIRDALVYE